MFLNVDNMASVKVAKKFLIFVFTLIKNDYMTKFEVKIFLKMWLCNWSHRDDRELCALPKDTSAQHLLPFRTSTDSILIFVSLYLCHLLGVFEKYIYLYLNVLVGWSTNRKLISHCGKRSLKVLIISWKYLCHMLVLLNQSSRSLVFSWQNQSTK